MSTFVPACRPSASRSCLGMTTRPTASTVASIGNMIPVNSQSSASDCPDTSVVVAADAGADARDVGAVDVDGDRRRVAGVVDAMDVAGGRESADLADLVVALADQVEVLV